MVDGYISESMKTNAESAPSQGSIRNKDFPQLNLDRVLDFEKTRLTLLPNLGMHGLPTG